MLNKNNDSFELSQFEFSRLKNIQQALLPRKCPHCVNMPIASHNIMKDHIGGDFYDFTRPDQCHWGFFVGDATGHGITAATVAAVTYGMMQHICVENFSPADVLKELNIALFGLNSRVKELPYPFSSTSFYGVLDINAKSFSYSNAGHPAPILINSETKTSELLEPTGPPLGFSDGWKVAESKIPIVSGTKLVIYTDGLLTEKTGGFDMFQLRSLTESLADLPPQEIVDNIFAELNRRTSGRYDDDVTVIAVDFSLVDPTCVACDSSPENQKQGVNKKKCGNVK